MRPNTGTRTGEHRGTKADRIQRMLERMRSFSSLRTSALQQLAASADELDAPRGTVLFESGEPSAGLYVVISGCVKLMLPHPATQRELVISLIRHGQCFDAAALLDDTPHGVSAITACRTRLICVPKQRMQRLLERSPALSYLIAKELSRVVYDLVLRLRDAPGGSLGKHRLIRFLLKDLPAGQRTGPAAIVLPESKRAIAAKLQITPEHLSRVLRELNSNGLLSVDGSHVHIHDVGGLIEVGRMTSTSKQRAITTRRSNARPSGAPRMNGNNRHKNALGELYAAKGR